MIEIQIINILSQPRSQGEVDTILVLETQYFSCCLLHFSNSYLSIYLKTKKPKKNSKTNRQTRQNKKEKRKGRKEKEGPQQNLNPVPSG